MINKIIILLFWVSYGTYSFAQKADILEARTCLKGNKNLDKAEALMRKVVAMPEQKEKDRLANYALLADIVKKEYENYNESLYLKQLKDTSAIFLSLRNMIDTFESLDSIDALPDKKGRVQLRFRKKHAEYLNLFRKNLIRGAQYYIAKQKYDEAYECLDTYLDCHIQPLFSSFDFAHTDTIAPRVAYLAVFCAYKEKNYDGVKKYEDKALAYDAKASHALMILYNSYAEQSNMERAVEYLKIGFGRHSENTFFFPRLVDYYAAINKIDTVQAIVEKALDMEPGNLFYRLAKNTLQLNKGEYDECIALGDSIIHNNDKIAVAYFNVGSSYFNKALLRSKEGKESKAKRDEVNEYYRQALPYVERYRLLRPRQQKKWIPLLYTIYFNLNMGEKFEEIDNLVKSTEINDKK
ncbi:MAG: hypothetical protein NC344_11290 [Bacteroidales bacterium]|nr:hypothetical protein [Bacteroidales bacterium]MCM1148390.1 hypothetical protein [Bacteroidales bacterium]MCM1207137.1 hypothetical protein [Bacillota bacterium]MCM1511370.1 hypothetical protein [Clostridium sp.]